MKREKIYIIPTQYGFMYGAGIFVSLTGGAIYSNNLAFVLCFFLVALFLIGMVQTHANIKSLSVEKMVLFLSPSEGRGYGVLWLKSQNPEGHSQLRVRCKDADDKIDFMVENIFKKSLHPQYFEFETGQWGTKKIKRIQVSARYPFGFFYTWRHFDCEVPYSVYPKPQGQQPLDGQQESGEEPGIQVRLGGDDFSEHKKYARGDSQKHIDWKAYARGRPLLVKQFNEGHREKVMIDFDKAEGSIDQKMHQMAQWVFECEANQVVYGLRLKSKEVPPSTGERHKMTCLKLLSREREIL